MAALRPGDKAPNFSLKNQDGTTVKLGDYKGKKLLVYFYPKADTSGCTKQACSVRDATPDLTSAGVAAVGISPDGPEKQKKFAQKHGLNFPLLCDDDHAVAQAYGAWGEKKMYGKTYEGIIRSSFLMDEKGKILGSWYKVKPEATVSNARKVLEAEAE
jgi:thioredoxin-dependent peroxiredoxin